MAKVSTTIQHDWMRFGVKFGDGKKITGYFGRNGETLKVEPGDPALERKLSVIVHQNKQKMRSDRSWNLGETFKVIESVARKSQTPEQFLAQLAAGLGVSGEITRPADAPAAARAAIRTARGGHVIDAVFPSGEKVELKINKSSVSMAMSPELSGPMDAMMNLVFGLKNFMGSNDEIADFLAEKAKESVDVSDWIDQAKAAMSPGARR